MVGELLAPKNQFNNCVYIQILGLNNIHQYRLLWRMLHAEPRRKTWFPDREVSQRNHLVVQSWVRLPGDCVLACLADTYSLEVTIFECMFCAVRCVTSK